MAWEQTATFSSQIHKLILGLYLLLQSAADKKPQLIIYVII